MTKEEELLFEICLAYNKIGLTIPIEKIAMLCREDIGRRTAPDNHMARGLARTISYSAPDFSEIPIEISIASTKLMGMMINGFETDAELQEKIGKNLPPRLRIKLERDDVAE